MVLRSQNRQYKRIQDDVGIRCRFTEPEVEALEEREFVLAPPGKDRFRGKSKGPGKNKRGRRFRKSSQYKSSNHGTGHRNGRRKGRGKRKKLSRGRSKKADYRA